MSRSGRVNVSSFASKTREGGGGGRGYLVWLDHLGHQVWHRWDALAAQHGHGLLLLGAPGRRLDFEQLICRGQEAGGCGHEQQVGAPWASSGQQGLSCCIARSLGGAVHHLVGVQQARVSGCLPALPNAMPCQKHSKNTLLAVCAGVF